MSRPELRHDIRITDTTLRDGSHAMAHQFTLTQVRDTVRALDDAGIEVIEVSHGDGLGGSSFSYGFSRTHEMELIEAARDTARNARIAVLLVPGIGTVNDLRRARDALHRGGRVGATLHRWSRARDGNGRVLDDGSPHHTTNPRRAGSHHGGRGMPMSLCHRLGGRAAHGAG